MRLCTVESGSATSCVKAKTCGAAKSRSTRSQTSSRKRMARMASKLLIGTKRKGTPHETTSSGKVASSTAGCLGEHLGNRFTICEHWPKSGQRLTHLDQMGLPFPHLKCDRNYSHAFLKGNRRLWFSKLEHALMSEYKGCSDRWMTRHGQFDCWGKEAYPVVIRSILSREHEGTLREIQFFGECLHRFRG